MHKLATLGGLAALVVGASVIGTVTHTDASSHREAPYISTDQLADATDLYAFVAPDATNAVTFVANYVPFQEPAGGPNFYKFGDDVLYEINIDNNGDASDDLIFQFRFRSDINPQNAFGTGTFLYNTGTIEGPNDPDQNVRQFYSVSLVRGRTSANRGGTLIADNLQVAPANVGPKTFPGNSYGTVAAQFNYTIGNGIKVFAGPRDDPFYVDLGKTFDLLNFGGAPEDYVAGKNVHSIVIQVPKDQLTANGQMPANASDPNAIIGVRTTSYRQSDRILRDGLSLGRTGGPQTVPTSSSRGPWVQISRLDIPLVNEAVITLRDKDRFNGSKPENDAQFLSYVQNSHLGDLLGLVLGVPNIPAAPRNDLVDVLLKGIPGLNRPANVQAASLLRLNMAIPPAGVPNKQGVLAGDNAGFPNGRRLTDDVVDIEFAVIAGCVAANVNCSLGDGVNANDVAFLGSFPYVGLPHAYD